MTKSHLRSHFTGVWQITKPPNFNKALESLAITSQRGAVRGSIFNVLFAPRGQRK